MPELNFSALELIVNSDKDVYEDHGFVGNTVNDVYNHRRNMWIALNGTEEGFEAHAGRNWENNIGGFYESIKFGDVTYWISAYRVPTEIPEDKRLDNMTMIQAHEQTHIVHHAGFLHLLETKMKSKGVNLNLSKYYDFQKCSEQEKEIVAILGEFYALQNKGVDIQALTPEGNSDPNFSLALRMYQTALQRI